MDQNRLLGMFPQRRVSPVDGMAVTPEVWEEAHAYHRWHQRFHALFGHGFGIITGLEVIASDPPNSIVYIMPGVAVGPDGHTIVIPRPVSYDLLGQNASGMIRLLLSYEESQPQPDSQGREDSPFYVRAGFVVEGRLDTPTGPQLELARVNFQDRRAPVKDAAGLSAPGPNEIDLRFRREIGAQAQETVIVGVSYLGNMAGHDHGRGLANLARAVSHGSNLRVWVNDGVVLGDDWERYTLVALVAREAFRLERSQMNVLYEFVEGGGTLIVESCHREGGVTPPADRAFSELLNSLGVRLNDLGSDHRLLQDPHLFTAPPPGFETQGTSAVRVGDGIILSTHDYGCLWRGQRRHGPASREEIRAAMEWGDNIISYARQRRKKAKRP